MVKPLLNPQAKHLGKTLLKRLLKPLLKPLAHGEVPPKALAAVPIEPIFEAPTHTLAKPPPFKPL